MMTESLAKDIQKEVSSNGCYDGAVNDYLFAIGKLKQVMTFVRKNPEYFVSDDCFRDLSENDLLKLSKGPQIGQILKNGMVAFLSLAEINKRVFRGTADMEYIASLWKRYGFIDCSRCGDLRKVAKIGGEKRICYILKSFN